jgi:hypothetical protein
MTLTFHWILFTGLTAWPHGKEWLLRVGVGIGVNKMPGGVSIHV